MTSQRILIVGAPGAGKSHLARRLSQALDIPHIEVDKLFWQDDKGGKTNDHFIEELKNQLQQSAWICEGLLKHSWPYLLPRVTLVIDQSPSHWLILFRLLFRDGLNKNFLADAKSAFSKASRLKRQQVIKDAKNLNLKIISWQHRNKIKGLLDQL